MNITYLKVYSSLKYVNQWCKSRHIFFTHFRLMLRKGEDCISHSLTDESVFLCSQSQIWTCITLSPGADSGITKCLSLQSCSLLSTCSSILSPHSARAVCPWTCGPTFSLLFSCPVQHGAFRLYLMVLNKGLTEEKGLSILCQLLQTARKYHDKVRLK